MKFIATQKYSPESYLGAAFYLDDPSLIREALGHHPENPALLSMLLAMDYNSCSPEELAKFRQIYPSSPLPEYLEASKLMKSGYKREALTLLSKLSRTPVDLEYLRLSLSGERKLYDTCTLLPGGSQGFAMRTTTRIDLARKLARNLASMIPELRTLKSKEPAMAMDVIAGVVSFTLSIGNSSVDLSQAMNALSLEEGLLRELPNHQEELTKRFASPVESMVSQNGAERRNLNLLRQLEIQIYKSGNQEQFSEYRALSDELGQTAALRKLAEDPKYFTYLTNPVSEN